MKKNVRISKLAIHFISITILALIILFANGFLFVNKVLNPFLSVLILSLYIVFCIICDIAHSFIIISKDYLTGLISKDCFIRRCVRLMRSRKLSSFTAVFMNIKDFKYFNERYGSQAGDNMLVEFSNKISKYLKGKKFFCRLGGDNFILLLEKGSENGFLEFLSSFAVPVFFDGKENLVHIETRCGLYPIQENDTIKELFNNSSLALKQVRIAKNVDYVWFEQQILMKMIHEKEFIGMFKTAIENEEFLVYYQPKVDMATNKLKGAEALVRWMKNGKLLSPNDFIPIFEKEGLITQLDFYVFKKVCSDILDWQKRGFEIVTISSNFSKLHLKNKSFADDILAVVNNYKTQSYCVEIELTESSANESFIVFKQFVDKIHQNNIKISIDDFGTGYSSLSLLKNINADVVKLDKSFIDNVQDEKSMDYSLVCNLVKLIKDLKCEVICEGVETDKQAVLLQKAGCNLVQGYYYDKPLSHDEFEKRLANKQY